jgi:hypothetical protein
MQQAAYVVLWLLCSFLVLADSVWQSLSGEPESWQGCMDMLCAETAIAESGSGQGYLRYFFLMCCRSELQEHTLC